MAVLAVITVSELLVDGAGVVLSTVPALVVPGSAVGAMLWLGAALVGTSLLSTGVGWSLVGTSLGTSLLGTSLGRSPDGVSLLGASLVGVLVVVTVEGTLVGTPLGVGAGVVTGGAPCRTTYSRRRGSDNPQRWRPTSLVPCRPRPPSRHVLGMISVSTKLRCTP